MKGRETYRKEANFPLSRDMLRVKDGHLIQHNILLPLQPLLQ